VDFCVNQESHSFTIFIFQNSPRFVNIPFYLGVNWNSNFSPLYIYLFNPTPLPSHANQLSDLNSLSQAPPSVPFPFLRNPLFAAFPRLEPRIRGCTATPGAPPNFPPIDFLLWFQIQCHFSQNLSPVPSANSNFPPT